MTGSTPLDLAHAEMEQSDTARLRFFSVFADTDLHVLLDREATADTIEPKLYPVEGGEVALAFDTAERLATFAGGVAAFVTLPGRVLADVLSVQGIGLGLNFDVAPSSMLLPAEALGWLTRTLGGGAPGLAQDRIAELFPPRALPQGLLEALTHRLARATGLAERALLASARFSDGREGHILAILGADDRDHAALARAVNEALVFSGVADGTIDVAFFDPAHPVVARLERVAMRFDIAVPVARSATRSGPGTDPSRPPKLR